MERIASGLNISVLELLGFEVAEADGLSRRAS